MNSSRLVAKVHAVLGIDSTRGCQQWPKTGSEAIERGNFKLWAVESGMCSSSTAGWALLRAIEQLRPCSSTKYCPHGRGSMSLLSWLQQSTMLPYIWTAALGTQCSVQPLNMTCCESSHPQTVKCFEIFASMIVSLFGVALTREGR